MNVIKIDKKVDNHTDQIELVISILCFLYNKRLSKTEQKCLAFYVVYGVKEATDEMLIKAEIVPHIDSLRNVKAKLCKTGFLRRFPGVYKSYEVNMDSTFKPDNVLALLIKIDRS